MLARNNQPETLPGFNAGRTCGNCAHYRAAVVGTLPRGSGICGNGISGRIATTRAHGCGHGFYPDPKRWALGPGPGGIFREVKT